MVGLLAAGQGDKDHILPAGLLNLPGGNQPPGIAQQDDLQENLGVVSNPPSLVIPVVPFKTGSIQAIFHQCMNGELQGPGDLPPVVVPSFKLEWGSSQARDPGGGVLCQDLCKSAVWVRVRLAYSPKH